MENKQNLVSFFFLWVLIIAIISTILAFFIGKYERSKEVIYKDKVFSIIDNTVKINEKMVSNINDSYNVLIKIDDKITEGKVILSIITPKNEKVKEIEGLKYNEKYEGFDITGFQGILRLSQSYSLPKDAWQVKVSYYNYLGYTFLKPEIIFE